jgi:integrase
MNKAENEFRFFPRADCDQFLDEMKQRAMVMPRLVVFHVLSFFRLRTGCRIGEACVLLKWEDIDWEIGEPRVIYDAEQW